MSDFKIANGYYMEEMSVLDAIRDCRKKFMKKFGYVPRNIVLHPNDCDPVTLSRLGKLNVKVKLSVNIQTRHVFIPVIKRKPRRLFVERTPV